MRRVITLLLLMLALIAIGCGDDDDDSGEAAAPTTTEEQGTTTEEQASGGAEAGGAQTLTLVADPGGDLVGAWQAGEHTGFGVFGEPNTPGWFELHTKSYDAAVAFYTDVFEWDAHTVADEPGFRYTTYGEGAGQLAGIIDSSAWPDDPAGWHVYFTVADIDATVARAVELGATVVDPPEDTPYGRLATLLDPNGARFKLQQP